ncbi:hypothetical protein HK100_006880 [Physocladia obscura]|uniref:Uncharacterized protein n=1 Tax=Physocladia obscura TaxID=109957 RepID=A0AAD5SRN7_9FUNG|nr:hypothetical protein HK100_006880 [Physocladia obscura]
MTTEHHSIHPHNANSTSHANAAAHAAEVVSAKAADHLVPPVNAYEVGWLFVQEYYTFLNKEPQKLHCFYNSKSSFIHGMEGESMDTQAGQKEIQTRITELDFEDCKVLVSNVDSQLSHGGCIVIMVLGEMSNKGGASHKFSQCFVLAEQPSGYFVYNDMFRFLKEDIDNEYDEPADPMGENDYYNNVAQQHNHHHHHNNLSNGAAVNHTVIDVASVEPIVQSSVHISQPNQQQASSTSPSPVVVPTSLVTAPRGRSPSPKKESTPQPIAATLVRAKSASPALTSKKEVTIAPIGKPSPIVSASSTLPVPSLTASSKPEETAEVAVAIFPSAITDVTVATPAAVPSATAASATAVSTPGSPTKGGKKKQSNSSQAAAATTTTAESAAAAAPASPAKPKTWATLAAGSTSSTNGTKPEVAAVKKPVQTPPSSSQNNFKKTQGGEDQSEFREVQRNNRGNGAGGAPSSYQNNNSNNNNNGRQFGNQKQLSKDDYSRSIFFIIPGDQTLSESAIREFFSQAGNVVEVILPPGKGLCFVEFDDATTASTIIGKPVTINGKLIRPEPRKPRVYNNNNNNNNNGNNSGNGGGGNYNGNGRGQQQRYSGPPRGVSNGYNNNNNGGNKPQNQQGKAAV